MPRITIIVEVDKPEDMESIASWFSQWETQFSYRSENHGCGCCVDIWEVEATQEAIAALPRQCHAGDEWTFGD